MRWWSAIGRKSRMLTDTLHLRGEGSVSLCGRAWLVGDTPDAPKRCRLCERVATRRGR